MPRALLGVEFVNWIKLGLAQVLLVVSCPVLAESKWFYVSDVIYPYSTEKFIAQIDGNSLTIVGNNVRYWLRVVQIDTNSPNPITAVHAGPSLYEDDCALNRFRVVQGAIIWGYDGPSIPISRPAQWQFVAPDGLAEQSHEFVCGKVRSNRKQAG